MTETIPWSEWEKVDDQSSIPFSEWEKVDDDKPEYIYGGAGSLNARPTSPTLDKSFARDYGIDSGYYPGSVTRIKSLYEAIPRANRQQIEAQRKADEKAGAKRGLSGEQEAASREPFQTFLANLPVVARGAFYGAMDTGRVASNIAARATFNGEWADKQNRLMQFQKGLSMAADRESYLAKNIGPHWAENVGMLSDVIGKIATSPLKGVKGLAALYATSTADQSYTQGKDAGLSDKTAAAYAAGMGALEAGLMLGFGALGKSLGVMTAEEAMLTKGTAEEAIGGIKGVILGSLLESTEEGATQAAQKAWAVLTGAEDDSDPWETAKDIFRAMEVGGAGGLGSHGVSAIASKLGVDPNIHDTIAAALSERLKADPKSLEPIVEKHLEGKPITRRDLEKAGLPSGGTTAETRAEIAGVASEVVAAKPGEAQAIATKRRIAKEEDWEAKSYEGRKPQDADYTPEKGRSWLDGIIGRSPSDAWSASEVADWIRRSHPDGKYWRYLKDSGLSLKDAVAASLADTESRADKANRALAAEGEQTPDLSGPRTSRPPLSKAESDSIFNQISRMQKSGEITEEVASALKNMPRQDAADLIDEASVRSQADAERIGAIAQDYRDLVGTGQQASSISGEANIRERAGGDMDKARGFDQLVEGLRSGQYPSLQAEAEARGNGDLEAGLAEIVRGGAGQYLSPSAGGYLGDLVAEYQSSLQQETSPEVFTEPVLDTRPQESASKPLTEEVIGAPEAAPTAAGATPEPAVSKEYVSDIEVDLAEMSKIHGTPYELSSPQTEDDFEAIEFLRSLGVKAVFVKSDGPMTGATGRAVDTIYLKSGTGEALWDTVGHELAHSTGFDVLSEADEDLINEHAAARLEVASEKYGQEMRANPDLMRREGVSGIVGSLFRDPAFRERVKNNNPGLWRKVRELILKLFRKYTPKDAAAREFLDYLRENPGQYVPTDTPVLFSEEDPVGLANAYTDARRALLGLPERLPPTPETFRQWSEEAREELKTNPNAGYELVDRILNSYADSSAGKEAAKLAQHQMELGRKMEDQLLSGALPAEVMNSQDVENAFEAGNVSGTEHARALVARQMPFNPGDFSLMSMVGKMRKAKGGEKLTDAEAEQIADIHAKGKAAAQAKRDAVEGPVRRKLQKTIDGMAKQKKKGKAVTDEDLERVATDRNSPHSAQTLSDIARRLAKEAIDSGITDTPHVVDYVHGKLSEHMDISQVEVGMAISRYGIYRPLSTEATAVKLRQISSILLSVSKLNDIWSGRPPKRTGFGKSEKSEYERKLTKLVNDERKKYGIESVDPEKQLKSALDAVKTRLKNQITDLNNAVHNHARIIKDKRLLPYDDDYRKLLAQRDAAKALYDETFGKPELTDEQRRQNVLKALASSLDGYNKKIADADFDYSGPTESLWDTEISEAYAARNAKAKEYREKKLKRQKETGVYERRKLDKSITQLANTIAELDRKIAESDFGPGQPSSPWSPGLSILHAKKAARLAQYQELKALDPAVKATKEMREAYEVARRRAQQQEVLLNRIANKDFEKGTRNKKEYRFTPDQKQVVEDYERAKAEFSLGVRRTELSRQYTKLRDTLSARGVPEVKAREKRILPTDVQALEYDISVMQNLARQAREQEEKNKAADAIEKAWNVAAEPWRLKRTLQYGVDAGQIGRQLRFVYGHPGIVAESIKELAKSITSEAEYNRVMDQIYKDSQRWVAEKGGLDLTGVHGPIHNVEELFQSEAAKKIWGLKQFGRGYTASLNVARFLWWKQMYNAIPDPTMEDARAIATMVNIMTGRGKLGERASRAAPFLNDFFTATRFQLSRAQILTLYPLWNSDFRKSSKQTKLLILKEFGRSVAGVAAYYGALGAAASMYAYMGYDDDEDQPILNLNPVSWMFGTVRFGEDYVDPLGGVKQHFVMASKIAAALTSNSPHKPWSSDADTDITRFIRGRLAPFPAEVADYVTQRTFDNERPDILWHQARSFLPLGVKEASKNLREHGWGKAATSSIINFVGEGLTLSPGTEVIDPWGRYMPGVREFHNIGESNLRYKLTKADMLLEDWNGRNLDDQVFITRTRNRYTEDGEDKQFDQKSYLRYQKLAGAMANKVAEEYTATISSATKQQAEAIREIVNTSRQIARDVVKGEMEGRSAASVLGKMKYDMGAIRKQNKGESNKKYQLYRERFHHKMSLINTAIGHL